jgi:hypothetical protein
VREQSRNISGPIEEIWELFCATQKRRIAQYFVSINFQRFILKITVLFVICANADYGLVLLLLIIFRGVAGIAGSIYACDLVTPSCTDFRFLLQLIQKPYFFEIAPKLRHFNKFSCIETSQFYNIFR